MGTLLETALALDFRDPDVTPGSRYSVAGQGFAAEHIRIESAAAFSIRVSGENHYVAVHDIVLSDGEIVLDGVPVSRTRDLRNAITFIPRGCAATGWSAPVERQNAFTALHFAPDRLRDELDLRYSLADPAPFLYRYDIRLQSTLLKLQAHLRGGEPDPLYAETLCMVAALELLGCAPPPVTAGLSPRQLRAIFDYIDTALGNPITLADLAAAANLSRFHFARSFKLSVGQSPYNYILNRRVSRAVHLLQSSDTPIELVARTVGFNSASQFGRAFRKLIGEAPGTFRRKRKGR